jgi:heat shock protein HslJ
MARRRNIVIAVTVIAALLAVGMGGLVGARALQARAAAGSLPHAHSAAAQPAAPAASLTGHLWKLVAFTSNGNPQRIARGPAVTLRFLPDIHTLGGRSGCNEYGATYALTSGHIQISGLNYTQMACFSAAIMAQEARFHEALPRMTTYHLDSSGLTLSDGAGAYTLRFV